MTVDRERVRQVLLYLLIIGGVLVVALGLLIILGPQIGSPGNIQPAL